MSDGLTSRTVRIATRPSRLALAQTWLVIEHLRARLPDVRWDVLPIKSEGDLRADVPLRAFGDKAAFVSAVESALIDRRADLAVHSLKDVPLEITRGLRLCMFLPREDPRDVLVSGGGQPLSGLAPDSRIGTSSIRRARQLSELRSDLRFIDIRGNVETRLGKLRRGDYDVVILAAAGLKRLGLESEIGERLAPEVCTPAPGQGIITVQCRDNYELGEELVAAGDTISRVMADAERFVARQVGATCTSPFGVLASVEGSKLRVGAWLGSDSESRRAVQEGDVDDWRNVALSAATSLTS